MKPGAKLGLLLGLWLLALAAGTLLGGQSLSLGSALAGEPTAAAILWQLRLPRALLALLAGGVLALSGLSFQSVFRNPLAEPYTLGVAGGAALGAVLALVAFPQAALVGVGIASFLGALAATAVVVGLSFRREGLETSTLLLAGVAISVSSSALILFLEFFADPHRTFQIVRWLMGGLAVVGYREVLWLAPFALAELLLLLALRWELNLLLTGEETAAARGVDVGRTRLLMLAGVSLAVGAVVAVAGPIGFVGLIVPNALRSRLGPDHLHLIPASLLAGGAFLALCDLGARTLLAPAELPVGVLTAAAGGPFFLWLLLRRR
ncbi:MAG: iron ABC transporter permease [Thermoanaerobaculia bacterium]